MSGMQQSTSIDGLRPSLGNDALARLARDIKRWGIEAGFDQIGICDTDLSEHEPRLIAWLRAGLHGEMTYMARHGVLRSRPAELAPGTLRVISARMNYLARQGELPQTVLDHPAMGYVSRYALGRDYHKVLRRRLRSLAEKIAQTIGPHGYRVFSDSAPVLEKALAEKAGLGWIGKHTNLLSRDAGSWFFLGEILTDLPLPTDMPAANHCGSCRNCIDACPTGAILGPYRLDARRCIAYLTIELRGPIPVELRPLMGNRIFGCDDCQLVCPWNRFAKYTGVADFSPRRSLDAPELCELFAWTENEFLQYTEGSPIRRVGYEGWLRNVAVALGNALRGMNDPGGRRRLIAALDARRDHPSALVREHVQWAIAQ
jgi:epoxyqueuosine reductase